MKRILVLLMVLVMGVTSFAGWSRGSTRLSDSTFLIEQMTTEENHNKLINVRPPAKLNDSLERKQINMRTKLWNNPSKVAYVYIYSHGGHNLGFYVIKGKVSSVNSQVTNPMQVKEVYTSGSGANPIATVPSPAEDGSYGTNGDGIFFFTTDGTYVETNLDYTLVDKPLKITSNQLM